MHYLNTILAFITHHPTLAYGTIFLISISSSVGRRSRKSRDTEAFSALIFLHEYL